MNEVSPAPVEFGWLKEGQLIDSSGITGKILVIDQFTGDLLIGIISQFGWSNKLAEGSLTVWTRLLGWDEPMIWDLRDEDKVDYKEALREHRRRHQSNSRNIRVPYGGAQVLLYASPSGISFDLDS